MTDSGVHGAGDRGVGRFTEDTDQVLDLAGDFAVDDALALADDGERESRTRGGEGPASHARLGAQDPRPQPSAPAGAEPGQPGGGEAARPHGAGAKVARERPKAEDTASRTVGGRDTASEHPRGAIGSPGASDGESLTFPRPHGGHGHGRRNATPWAEARHIAARAAGGPLPAVVRGLGEALGHMLAEPLVALTDLPSFDSSAMDGWAVAGPGPWQVDAAEGAGILAGHDEPASLPDGRAVRIATGARVPAGTTAVLRSEHGETRERAGKGRGGTSLHVIPGRSVPPGQDIRPRGQECRTGDRLLPAGVLITPAVVGLAAAAGYDELRTVPRPRVEILVLGDELLSAGLPRDGRIRDALGPMLGPWLGALGAEVITTRHLRDDAEALHTAVTTSPADLVITTGGTASGPVDHVHPVLRRAGATLLVDGVAVRPGHPMLFAELAPGTPGTYLVGLPGNPLAAVSGLLTLAEPLLRTLSGRGLGAPGAHGGGAAAVVVPLTDAVQGHPHDTRLVPAAVRSARGAEPLHFNGPAMLRGVAAADGLAVIPPGGADAGTAVEILPLPWKAGQGAGPAWASGTTGGLAPDSTPRPAESGQPGGGSR